MCSLFKGIENKEFQQIPEARNSKYGILVSKEQQDLNGVDYNEWSDDEDHLSDTKNNEIGTLAMAKNGKISINDEDMSLKKHLKQLLILQKSEKGVEDEILKLKDKIYKKMQQRGLSLGSNKLTPSLQSSENGDISPFGNLGNQQETLKNFDTRPSRSIERSQYRSFIDEKNLVSEDNQLKLPSVENLHHFLKMAKMSNKTRFMNLNIENHGTHHH